MDDMTELLTIREFAQRLHVTEACIRKWVLKRTISSTRLGRLVRIPASEATNLVKRGFIPVAST